LVAREPPARQSSSTAAAAAAGRSTAVAAIAAAEARRCGMKEGGKKQRAPPPPGRGAFGVLAKGRARTARVFVLAAAAAAGGGGGGGVSAGRRWWWWWPLARPGGVARCGGGRHARESKRKPPARPEPDRAAPGGRGDPVATLTATGRRSRSAAGRDAPAPDRRPGAIRSLSGFVLSRRGSLRCVWMWRWRSYRCRCHSCADAARLNGDGGVAVWVGWTFPSVLLQLASKHPTAANAAAPADETKQDGGG
jgi:hypothetical protein